MPGTEKNAEALSRIIASVAASQDFVLRELGSRGMVSELKEYIDTIEKLMNSVSSIKIPKRPAMHSDSPKKNEQELLKYQRRLEKLNVVFDEYNKKVQKANEKSRNVCPASQNMAMIKQKKLRTQSILVMMSLRKKSSKIKRVQ